MAKILIKSNELRNIFIRTANNLSDAQSLIVLIPGWNEADDSLWEAAKKLGSVKAQLTTMTVSPDYVNLPESRRPKMLEEGKKVPAEKGISGLSVEEMVSIAAETTDTRLLARWRAEDRRADVRAAIDKAIIDATPVEERKAG